MRLSTMAAELSEVRDEYLATAERTVALIDAIAYMSVRIALSRVSDLVGADA